MDISNKANSDQILSIIQRNFFYLFGQNFQIWWFINVMSQKKNSKFQLRIFKIKQVGPKNLLIFDANTKI